MVKETVKHPLLETFFPPAFQNIPLSYSFCFPNFSYVRLPTCHYWISWLSLPTPLVISSTLDGCECHLYADHSQMCISRCPSLQIYIFSSLFYRYTHVYDGHLKLTYIKLNSRSYLPPLLHHSQSFSSSW